MKKILPWLVGLAVLAGILALIITAPRSGPIPVIDSGVRGMVLLGPTCPVQRIPPDPNCADRPYQADFIILSSAGDAFAISSGADGKFEIQLPAGDYTITPSSNGKMLPRAGAQQFAVHAGQYTEIQIQFDSGIR